MNRADTAQNKPSVAWITISQKRSGGFQYGAWVRKKLAPWYDVELVDLSFRSVPLKFVRSFLWVFGLASLWFCRSRDVWIRDFVISGMVPLWTRRKNIFLIHHIDPSPTVWPLWARAVYPLLERFIYFNMKRADAIVVISKYWEEHFRKRGFTKIYKIYNCFPLEEYQISEKEAAQFKKEFGLEGKPIVYLGNCQKGKGVVEACEALKDLPVHLVTSGEEHVKIPARNLNLSRQDFLRFLRAVDIGVFMTRFRTGWDMTACEAMLLKTPVVGVSIAAMRELLESSGQTICDDFGELKGKVEALLSDPNARNAQAERGYEFVRQFPLERLEKEWARIVKMVVQQP